MDTLSVTLHIINKPYKLKINAAHEQQIRGYIKQLNEQALVYKSEFGGLEDFDYLAMSLINVLSTINTQPASAQADNEVIQQLQRLSNILAIKPAE
jgi:hypothetical protein